MTAAVSGANTAYAPPQSSPAQSASTTTGLTSDFETFIKMLTAQARYQDPLEPLDSTEYASQLAQFSMVEQQVQGNDILTGLQAQMGLSNMAAMSGWVGMEARVTAPGYFDGTNPIQIAPNPAAAADEVNLVIRNADGGEVRTISLPVSAEPYQWDGTDEDGNAVEVGTYSFTLDSRRAGESLLAEAPEIYTRVQETQMQGNDVVLITAGGTPVLASSVTALRDPAT